MCNIAITIMDGPLEEESDSVYFDDQNSGSEMEDDEEIDLENLKLNDKFTWQSSYSSKYGITWSSYSNRAANTDSSNDRVVKSGLTEVTANITSIENTFLCFMPEKMLELKAFIELLLLAGLLGKAKADLKCLWRRSPIESPMFKATMSRSRFQQTIACLQFDDKKPR